MTATIGKAGEGQSLYLQYLPAIYQDEFLERDPGFLGRFLLSFQQIITGVRDPDLPGIEEILDGIPQQMAGIERYFEPGPNNGDAFRAPPEFLQWLSGWVAMNLRADYTIEQQREYIANAVQLYHWRGTKAGLLNYLQIFVGQDVTITIDENPAVPAVRDGGLGDGARDDPEAAATPYYFTVTLEFPQTPGSGAPAPAEGSPEMARFRQVVGQIVDQQKPAHTYFDLFIVSAGATEQETES